jgi:hypothetical protein
LGIVAAVLVMYLFAARSAMDVASVAEVSPRVDSLSVWDAQGDDLRTMEILEPRNSTRVNSAASAASAEIKAESDSASDNKVDAKFAAGEKESAKSSSTDDKKAPAKSPPPAWVGSEPTMENGVYRAAVVSGPYSTRRECEARLDEPLRKAMMEYANDYLPHSVRFHAWGNSAYTRDHLIESRYFSEDEYQHITQPMYNLHVLLKVDAEDVARFNTLAHEWQVRQAVEETSIGGLFVLGSLVVVYGALRYVGCKKHLGCKKEANPLDAPADAPSETTA